MRRCSRVSAQTRPRPVAPYVLGEEPVELQTFDHVVDRRQRAHRITAQLLTPGTGRLSRFELFRDMPPAHREGRDVTTDR